MSEQIDRRMMIALTTMSVLAACSRKTIAAAFSVNVARIPQVIEVVRSFARSHGYRVLSVEGAGPEFLNFEGRWSFFRFYKVENHSPGNFIAEFRHRDEVLFPRDDLESWLADLDIAIGQIEGVYE